jgi:hypothetical protein
MDKYGIQLDFDCESEPPKVYIADAQGRGCCYIEVLEEPYLVPEDWSWDDKDWLVGEMTAALLKFMNSKEFNL